MLSVAVLRLNKKCCCCCCLCVVESCWAYSPQHTEHSSAAVCVCVGHSSAASAAVVVEEQRFTRRVGGGDHGCQSDELSVFFPLCFCWLMNTTSARHAGAFSSCPLWLFLILMFLFHRFLLSVFKPIVLWTCTLAPKLCLKVCVSLLCLPSLPRLC